MAEPVTIVLSGGAPVVSTTSPSALPVTGVASGGRPVTLVTSNGLPVTFISETGASQSVLAQAIVALNGLVPYHYWDFTTNQALFAQADVGAVTSTPGWSFTRASTGYAQTTAGLLVSFASGAPRMTDKGLLVEEARTNLCLRSQELDDASWTKTRSSITANAIAAPDGTTTADKLVEDNTAASTHQTTQSLTYTAAIQTVSVYAKAAERSQIRIVVPASAFADVTARTADFDLALGIVGATAGSGVTSSIEALTSGWYRCVVGVPTTLAAAANVQILLAVAGSASYSGDGVSGLYLWGVQAEAGGSATSYIPTTTASVTRAADTVAVTYASISYPLSMYAAFTMNAANTGAFQAILRMDDGTGNNQNVFQLDASNIPTALVTTGGVSQAFLTLGSAPAANVLQKMAMRVNTNTVQAARNAALGTEDTVVTPPAVTVLRFGGSTGSARLNGYMKSSAIFNTALANAALQRATT